MEEFAQVERQLLDQSARLISREEYLAWEERYNECIESLEVHSRVKRSRLYRSVFNNRWLLESRSSKD